MAEPMELEQVLADEREAAQILAAKGYRHDAQLIDKLLDRVAAAAEPYLAWITEEEARLRSGRSVAWLRAQHPMWMAERMARLEGRRRFYRRCIVPKRALVAAAREAARRGERAAS